MKLASLKASRDGRDRIRIEMNDSQGRSRSSAQSSRR
jgi:hypothetical protein